jgi:hypothetical protein
MKQLSVSCGFALLKCYVVYRVARKSRKTRGNMLEQPVSCGFCVTLYIHACCLFGEITEDLEWRFVSSAVALSSSSYHHHRHHHRHRRHHHHIIIIIPVATFTHGTYLQLHTQTKQTLFLRYIQCCSCSVITVCAACNVIIQHKPTKCKFSKRIF